MITRWTFLLALALGAAALWLSLSVDTLGDYSSQAQHVFDAAARGDWAGFLSGSVSMGPVSLLVRLPFVLGAELFDAGEMVRYRVGVIPCALAASALAYALAARAFKAGATRPMAVAFAAIVFVNPFTLGAIDVGHPEELLTGALLVSAALVAPRGNWLLTAFVLGLALAAKQWALVGFVPVLLAAPAHRLRIAALVIGLAAVVVLPFVASNPSRFISTQKTAASVGNPTGFANVWWPFLKEGPRKVERGGSIIELSETRYLPGPLSRFPHPLIVVLPAILSLVIFKLRPLTAEDALGLLVVALLLRCVLDPINNVYYHVPALMALLAWETHRHPFGSAPAPLLSAAMAVAGWLNFRSLPGEVSLSALNALYLAWMLSLIAFVLWSVLSAGRNSTSPPANRPTLLRAGS